MKKIFLIALVANLSLALVANAQESKSSCFGVKAGLNLASTTDCTIKSGNNIIEIEGGQTTGFHAGLFDNYSFSRICAENVEKEKVSVLAWENNGDFWKAIITMKKMGNNSKN